MSQLFLFLPILALIGPLRLSWILPSFNMISEAHIGIQMPRLGQRGPKWTLEGPMWSKMIWLTLDSCITFYSVHFYIITICGYQSLFLSHSKIIESITLLCNISNWNLFLPVYKREGHKDKVKSNSLFLYLFFVTLYMDYMQFLSTTLK